MAVNHVMPFNRQRFDACFNYLAGKYEATLDQFEVTKLHVLIDFYHILKTGKPVIGGTLERWPHGPVLREGFNRVKTMGYDSDQAGRPYKSGKLRVVGRDNKRYLYAGAGTVEESDFSASEIQAMDEAWAKLMTMPKDDRYNFFHRPNSFMGKVWIAAKKDGTPISWLKVIEAYDRETGGDHSLAKAMVGMWQD